MERLHLSWEGLLALARRLAEALREEEFDLILGIARGGLIPTALLLGPLGPGHPDGGGHVLRGRGDPARAGLFAVPPDPLLFGKRVLVVDDVWDSGRTAWAVEVWGKA
jgi:hypoxanthine phosphoribosyltransferase